MGGFWSSTRVQPIEAPATSSASQQPQQQLKQQPLEQEHVNDLSRLSAATGKKSVFQASATRISRTPTPDSERTDRPRETMWHVELHGGKLGVEEKAKLRELFLAAASMSTATLGLPSAMAASGTEVTVDSEEAFRIIADWFAEDAEAVAAWKAKQSSIPHLYSWPDFEKLFQRAMLHVELRRGAPKH